jgi:cysteine-rich repeat protein
MLRLRQFLWFVIFVTLSAPQAAWALCGDGVVEAGETCDDGRRDDGDGCSALCQIEHPSGCADGQREGFVNIAAHPYVAGCYGAWTVPGARSIPACNRQAGDDAAQPLGTGCSAVDLCAVGWHVCGSVQDVVNSFGGATCADAVAPGQNAYFATQVSGPGNGHCSANPAHTNDNFGCGNVAATPQASCAPLNNFSHNLCSALPAADGWTCEGANGFTEQTRIRKLLPQNGGVMCCFGPTYTVTINEPGVFTNNNRPMISGSSDAPDGTVISVVLPGQQVVTATVMGGVWSVMWPGGATALVEGVSSTIEATAYDPLTGFAGSRASTTYVNCGSGTIGPGEQCDDGNRVDGDGCDATCQIEACGNGLRQQGEQCDDGNMDPGDGCAMCQIEPGYTCPVAGGRCLTVALVSPMDGVSVRQEPLYSGTATPGAVVTVTWTDAAGQVVATALVVANAQGGWTAAAQGLDEGMYVVKASVSTSGGQVSQERNFTLDTTPPAVAVLAPADGLITADTTPTLSGTAEVGAAVLVEVLDGAGQVVFSFMDPTRSGMWSVEAGVLPAGMYTVRATATDAAGNSGTSSTGFMIDTAAPMLVLLTPTAGQVFGASINMAGLSVTGAVDADATVLVTVRDMAGNVVASGAAIVAADGSFVFDVPGMGQFVEGGYTVEVDAVRPNGESSQVTAPIAVDLSTTGALVQPAAGGVIRDNTPTLSGTGEPGAMVVVSAGGQPVCMTTVDAQGVWSCEVGAALAEGDAAFTATFVDGAGNVFVAPGVTVTVDTTPPVLRVDNPQSGSQLNPLMTISGTGEPGAEVTVVIDGMVIGTVTVAQDGTWSLPAPPLVPGMYTVTATAKDAAGNTTEVIVHISIPTIDPIDMGMDMDTPDMAPDMDTPDMAPDMDTPDMDVDMAPDMDVTGDMGADMSGSDMSSGADQGDDAGLILAGGCAQAPGAPAGSALWLVALGLWAARRRRA